MKDLFKKKNNTAKLICTYRHIHRRTQKFTENDQYSETLNEEI